MHETDLVPVSGSKFEEALIFSERSKIIMYSYCDNLLNEPIQTVGNALGTLQTDFDTVEVAVRAVQQSRNHGVLYFPKNFSQNMMSRIKYQTAAPTSAIDGSTISAWMDMSEFGMTVKAIQELGELVIDFIQDICEECGFERKMASIPLSVEEKIFDMRNKVHSFVPSYFGSLAFYTTMMYTSSSIVMERASGVFERSKIAGLTMFEILIAHIAIQFVVMSLQNMFSFTVLYGIFDNPMRGSMSLAWVIVSVNELAGMVFGIFLAVIIRVETNVTYAGIGTVLGLFMLTGVIWPVEGIHWSIQPLSALLSVKYSGEAYLDVAIRGYGINRFAVFRGLLAPILSIFAFGGLSFSAVKLKLGSFQ